MTFGNTIAYYRKKLGITQEALAKQLDVTNQAVSKWESNVCCPDIQLLPAIADIFGISIDRLFGRNTAPDPDENNGAELPWEDDGVLRAVLYIGKKRVMHHEGAREFLFEYDGPALNVSSDFSVSCGDVDGTVSAGSNVSCGDIDGSVNAGGNLDCGDIDGSVIAGGTISCGDIDGPVSAGGNVSCGDVSGSASAGGSISCGDIENGAKAGCNISCGDISGHVEANSIKCDSIN